VGIDRGMFERWRAWDGLSFFTAERSEEAEEAETEATRAGEASLSTGERASDRECVTPFVRIDALSSEGLSPVQRGPGGPPRRSPLLSLRPSAPSAVKE
jgi:hypothetical protein